MPDPALLALLQHFAGAPPAIVQPAEIVDAEPFLSAFEVMAVDQDREFQTWLRIAEDMRERMRLAIAVHPQDFPAFMFDDLIARFVRFMDWERKAAARRERSWRGRPASDRLRRLQDRTACRSRGRFAAADDLILFLKAMQAETAVDSRGGPTFEDPEQLERYILGAIV